MPAKKEPLFRLEAGGPTSRVTALAFSPDGQTLYAAGGDKVVRVWRLYLVGGAMAFRDGRMGVDQILMVRPDGPHTLPWERDW